MSIADQIKLKFRVIKQAQNDAASDLPPADARDLSDTESAVVAYCQQQVQKVEDAARAEFDKYNRKIVGSVDTSLDSGDIAVRLNNATSQARSEYRSQIEEAQLGLLRARRDYLLFRRQEASWNSRRGGIPQHLAVWTRHDRGDKWWNASSQRPISSGRPPHPELLGGFNGSLHDGLSCPRRGNRFHAWDAGRRSYGRGHSNPLAACSGRLALFRDPDCVEASCSIAGSLACTRDGALVLDLKAVPADIITSIRRASGGR